MSHRHTFGITLVFLALITAPVRTPAQSSRDKNVRLEVTRLGGNASFALNGKDIYGRSLLDVLREAQPNGTAILSVFFHLDSTSIRDIREVLATADKQGGFVEKHIFIRCYDTNRPAWCEVTFGKPVIEAK